MRDMSKGDITKQMVIFAIPLMLGNIFQQLYGVINSVVVGRYLGKAAFAATGTAIPVINIMMFLLLGMTMGASVLMAEFFGAGDEKRLKEEISTSVISGLIFTVLLTAAGMFCVEPALRLTRAPAEIMPQAASYLRIIFAGLLFAFPYNLMSSAMRAVGESTAPLLFLIFSSLMNIALAVAFVGTLGMGVEGAALATVISQAVSVLLCLIYIKRKLPLLLPDAASFRISLPLLRTTASYSSVSGVQQAVIYVGIFLLQGAVNPLGIDAIAAFYAVCRIDEFVLAPNESLTSSLMMFVSQNRGAGNDARIRKGVLRSAYVNHGCTAACSLILFLMARTLVSMFLGDAETTAIAMGTKYLKFMSVIYLLSASCNTFQGFFRGIGRMDVTLYATLIQIPTRIVLTYILAGSMGINAVAAATGAGWALMTAYLFVEYLKYLKAEALPAGERMNKYGIDF